MRTYPHAIQAVGHRDLGSGLGYRVVIPVLPYDFPVQLPDCPGPIKAIKLLNIYFRKCTRLRFQWEIDDIGYCFCDMVSGTC